MVISEEVYHQNCACRRGSKPGLLAANAVRLELHALAYNLANFLRTLTLPEAVKQWSLTTLRAWLVKIGARIGQHDRSMIFRMAEVAALRLLFAKTPAAIATLRLPPPDRC